MVNHQHLYFGYVEKRTGSSSKAVNASLRLRRMSKSEKRNQERGDRFTYRTSGERGQWIRQRAAETRETYEEILDKAVDRYRKDPKVKNNRTTPKNATEIHYIERLLPLLRDRESKLAPGFREAIDILLRRYQESPDR